MKYLLKPINLFIGGIGDDNESVQLDLFSQNKTQISNPKSKSLTPVAYLWTSTVKWQPFLLVAGGILAIYEGYRA